MIVYQCNCNSVEEAACSEPIDSPESPTFGGSRASCYGSVPWRMCGFYYDGIYIGVLTNHTQILGRSLLGHPHHCKGH